jgi:hypothetical protein
MKLERYAVVSGKNHEVYEFLSEGSNGTIRKVVFYEEVGLNLFNLAFGDWDEIDQRFNDQVRSNNNDRGKVLATVAFTVIDFIKYHPKVVVIAKGSTPARTRLYQMGISAYWYEIGHLFDIKDFNKGDWYPFERGENYQAFALKAKGKM